MTQSLRDRRILYTTTFLRSLATGLMGVLLGIYLANTGLTPGRIGAIIAAGLAGGAVGSLVITLQSGRIHRRNTLYIIAFLTSLGGLGIVFAQSHWALILVTFVGMLNGMGRDRGAASIIEQVMLPETTDTSNRTQSFAWLSLFQDAGNALGGAMVGLTALLVAYGFGKTDAYRALFIAYSALSLLAIPLYAGLSKSVSTRKSAPFKQVSPESRRQVRRISSLFLIDSVAGGFLTTALVSYFLYERFGVSEAALGALFFAARVLNSFSHLGAAWLAKRIGLVNTMVFTHIPSSLFLATVAIAPNFPVAVFFFLLREGLVEMDVPTRQSYVMAMVPPEDRTYASGVTSLVRMSGWAAAPTIAGWLMGGVSMALPLIIGAGMKVGYDLLLWRGFRHLPPPEEAVA